MNRRTIAKNHCYSYCLKKNTVAIELNIEEFNNFCKTDQFGDGPFKDSFGDGYGEPYNPDRQVFGTLKDGRVVYADLKG